MKILIRRKIIVSVENLASAVYLIAAKAKLIAPVERPVIVVMMMHVRSK